MPHRYWLLGALFATLLSGCHVFEKTEQCSALAKTMKEFEPRLAPRLPAWPSAQALRHKTELFGTLAKKLHELPLQEATIAQHRDELVIELESLSARLVEVEKTMLAAEKERHKREELHKRTEERRRKREEERLSRAKQHRAPVGGLGGVGSSAVKEPAPLPPKRPSPNSRPQPSHSLRVAYDKSKKAIEAEGHKIASTLNALSQACR